MYAILMVTLIPSVPQMLAYIPYMDPISIYVNYDHFRIRCFRRIFFRWALLSADRCISSCLSVVPSVHGILEKHGVQHPKTDHTCSIMLQDGKSHQKYGWFILVASTDD